MKSVERISNKIEHWVRRYRDYCVDGDRALKREKELIENAGNYRLNAINRNEKIIVSLTSYPARFDKLHFAIRSMLIQTMPPDEIILYLDEDVIIEEDGNQLPDSLIEMQKYGLRIEKREGNIKPHKKYYYAMKENPDALIITIDDDIMYSSQLIESLYKTHCMFPDCVVATRAHRIKYNNKGIINRYNDWHWADVKKNKPSLSLVATGVGGVLYPPHCMHEDLFNMDLLLKLSLNDDLWLKVMQIRKKTKVVLCDSKVAHNRAAVQGTQEQTLNADNVHKGINDIYMERLIKYYKLQAKDFGINKE